MTTTYEIKERIANTIIHELRRKFPDVARDILRKSVEDALAVAVSGEIKLLTKHAEKASLQGCPLTATSSTKSNIGGLENWGRVKLRRDPFPAVPGEYEITITGTGTYPAGTQFIDDVTEFVYILSADAVVVGTGTAVVRSVGEGTELIKEIGTILFAVQRVSGLNEEVEITDIITDPEASEDLLEYQDKIVQSFSITPRGGAIGDYRAWGLEIAGVFQIYPYTGQIPKEGTVYVQSTRTESNPNGIADETLVEEVYQYIEVREPATTGELSVYPILIDEYEITVTGLTDAEKEGLVLPALQEYFRAKFPFIAGIDDPDLRTDRVTKADIMGVVFNAVKPAGIADITIERNSLTLTDTFLRRGTVGDPTVIFA